MNCIDTQYNNLIKDILDNGNRHKNRTGIDTISVFGRTIRIDLSKEFPMLTSRKLPFKSTMVELEGFIKGIKSKQWYQDRGCNYWNFWSNPQKVLEKFNSYSNIHSLDSHKIKTYKELQEEEDDLGNIYGVQWRNFNGVDQLKILIENIRNNNDNRRLIVSAWNPSEFDNMALLPCHYCFQCSIKDGKLSLMWNQRSVDSVCGLPQNIVSYATLTHLLAREGNLEVGELIGILGDTHIYENHIESIKEQINRPIFCKPNIQFDNYNNIFEWSYNKIKLLNYQSGDKIKYEVAV